MNFHVEVGVITSASFGYGGYQDAMLVFELQVGSSGWGSTKTYVGGWIHRSDSAKWSEAERIKRLGESAWEVFQLIRDAKKKYLHELKGVPIRAYFKSLGGELSHIEIFKEVLSE